MSTNKQLYNLLNSQQACRSNNMQGLGQASLQSQNASYANQLYNLQQAVQPIDYKELLELDIKHLMDEERATLMIELMHLDDEQLMLFKLFLSK